MARTFIQNGTVMDFANGSGANILSGDVVLATDRVGVALSDIANGNTGSVRFEGVFELPKAAGAITQGESVYWDTANSNIVTTASGNKLAGYAFQAAANDDAVVQVKLNA